MLTPDGVRRHLKAAAVELPVDDGHVVTKVATGQGQWTQQDHLALVGTLLFSNFLPVVWTSNAMMQWMPTHDPTPHKTHC